MQTALLAKKPLPMRSWRFSIRDWVVLQERARWIRLALDHRMYRSNVAGIDT